MKTLLAFGLALAAAACTPMEPVAHSELDAAQDADLGAALAGRSEGPTVNCVSQRMLAGNRSFGEGVVLFRTTTGGTVYVNRPTAGCPDLRARTLVVRTTSGQLCRGDIASVVDPVSGFETGSCVLGGFTPYRR